MRSGRFIFIFFFLLYDLSLFGQTNGSGKEYFFPIMPNENNYLSGTMGEIRSTHFHAGIDVKTGGRTGLPVYATYDGHVSRIAVSPGGYGHALYILHRNGETSVYCHLLQFREDIAEYVLEQQYKKQSFRVNLFPSEKEFVVKKGDLIGLSGNSGSSLGPHLHFEIRDQNQRPVNPLMKGFKEIKDQVPPTVYAIALKSMSIDARIDHQFGRAEFKVKSKGNEYYIDTPIEVYGRIGFQLKAYDRLNGVPNRNGVPYITVNFDGKKILEVQIETFSFSDTRHVINYYDFTEKKENNGIFQKMYLDDGNNLPIYPYVIDKGLIEIRDEELHELSVKLKDAYGNTSSLIIPIQGAMPKSEIEKMNWQNTDQIATQLFERFLKITAPLSGQAANQCQLYSNRMKYELMPAYHSNELAVYLWDMNQGIPDSIRILDVSKDLNYKVMLPSGVDFNYYNKMFNIKSYRRSLYDTVFLEADYIIDADREMEVFTIGSSKIPLANSIQITFKPRMNYQDSDKYAVYNTNNLKNFSFAGNIWDQNEITITTRNLGIFTILEDTIPPTIRPVQVNNRKVGFKIDDDLSGIKEYDAYINDEWVLMHYDPKQKYIWSETLKPNNSLIGAFKLTVKDNVGNTEEYTTRLQ